MFSLPPKRAMRNFVLLICLGLLVAPVWAKGTPEQVKAIRYLDRADRSLDSLEKQLAKDLPLNDAILARWQKRLSQAEEYLKKAQELGGGDSSVEQRAGEVRQRFQKLGQKVAARESGLAEAESAATSGGGQAALTEYQRLASLFRDVNGYLRDNRGESPELMQGYRNGLVAQKELDSRYQAVLQTGSRSTFDLRAAAEQASQNRRALEQTIESLKTQLPLAVRAQLKKAEDYARDLQKTGAFGAWETNVEREVEMAKLRLAKFRAVSQSEALVSLEAEVAQAEARLNQLKAQFRAQIIANNKPPADLYRGGDSAALKAAVRQQWQSKHPGDRVLDVRIFDADWSRFQGFDWDGGARVWRPYDYSRMRVAVVVAAEGQKYKFGADLVRHLGGKLKVFTSRPPAPVTDPKMILP